MICFRFSSIVVLKMSQNKFRRDRSYVDSPEWIKKEKATINPKNKDDEYFQYAVTVALNYGETESHPERVLNIKLFKNKYNW